MEGVSSYLAVEKFGQNPAIGTTEESVWDGGGVFPWLGCWQAGAVQVTLISDSVQDSPAGTRAGHIRVYGLDDGGRLIQEDVTLSATFTVTSINTFSFVYRMHSLEVGGTGDVSNGGNILMRPVGSGFDGALIRPGFGQTQMAQYVIPTGMVGILKSIYGASDQTGGATSARFTLHARDGYGFGWRNRFTLNAATGLFTQYIFPFPVVTFPAGSHIDMHCISDAAGGTVVDGGFSLELVSGQVR